MLLDVARGFVRDQAPIEAVRAQLETDTGYDAAIWQAMVDMGWAGIALPDTVGGAGMGVGSAVPVFEALGGGLLGTPLLSTTLAGQLIWRAAGESAAEWLGACVPGRWGRSPISTMPTGAPPIWAWSWVPTGRSRAAKALWRMPAWPTVLRSWPRGRRASTGFGRAQRITTARSQKTC